MISVQPPMLCTPELDYCSVLLWRLTFLSCDMDINPVCENYMDINPVCDKLVCSICSKLIVKNQTRTNCSSCKSVKHLNCLESCYDVNRTCQQCFVGMNDYITDDGIF